MIKLDPENLPVTHLKYGNLLRQLKINITIAFQYANILEIQDISYKKMGKFLSFWVPFDP